MIETFTNSKKLIKVDGKDREMQLSTVKTSNNEFTEVTLQRRSDKNMFWKYATNLQENNYAEVRFQ